MPAELPGVSCITPVHNGACYLAEAIRSIVGQTHRPLESIVVDDGSTDGSAEIAESFGAPVRVVRQDHGGVANARNRGVREARFELLAFLDADDIFHPEKLERQVARFLARPELWLSLCTAQNFWEPELAAERSRYESLGRTTGTHVSGTILARRELFERIGPFDESRPRGDVIFWLADAAAAGAIVEVLPDVLMRRRMHSGSVTHRAEGLDPYLDLLHSRIAARRATEGRAR